MFKKGGLSEETGIMSGLDSPRRNYAQGSYAPRVNYAEGTPYLQKIKDLYSKLGTKTTKLKDLYSRLGTNTLKGVRGPGFTMSPTYTGTSLPVPYSKPPLLSERGLIELAKKAGTKGAGILSSLKGNFPTVSKILSSPKVTLPGAVYSQYQMTKPEDYEKDYGISQIEKSLLSNIPGAQLYRQSLAKMAADKKSKEVEEEPIIPPTPEKIKDPEKSLMDVYGENKGIIDEVMGSSDEDTKKSMWLQLAKFGAGVAAQPGGDLVGAIGKAAEKPLEGVEATLAEKRKGDRETKLMALQKTFKDMEEPEQIKLVKSIQKEYGFDSFKEAYDYISKPKRSSAEIRADNEFYRTAAKEMNVSTEGFRREMENLDDLGLGDYVGYFTRTDAKLPEKADERTDGEYYVNDKGKPMRWLNGKLYGPTEPGFTKKIKTQEA